MRFLKLIKTADYFYSLAIDTKLKKNCKIKAKK